MNEAELYHKSNSLQKRDALKCLQEYNVRIKWRRYGGRIIDIGCGDGSVTTDILKNHMPNNYDKLIGCDISEEMIRFANERHKDERTHFTVLDIEGEVPEEMQRHFHHAFSFYTLHWINQQKKAFMNIYNLLTEGGDCLLIFLGHMPMFDVYRIMSTSPKWRRWLSDVEKYVSPYHDSQEPEKDIKKIMNEVGFKNVDVQCKESTFIYYQIEILKKSVMAVNPFSIPKDLQDDFMDDYLDIVRDLRLMDQVNNNIHDAVSIKTHYSLLVVYGRK